MAQSYQHHHTDDDDDARRETAVTKASGIYQKAPKAAEGGWGFVLPRPDGTLDIVPARNGAIIGSGSTADVRIEGPAVAEEHARIDVRADGAYLEDLDSAEGTFVGGVRARRIGVSEGDVVRFGRQLAIFVERALLDYRGKIDLASSFVVGPRDRALFVEPALAYARAGQPFTIEGGPSLGKRTLARLAAEPLRDQGPTLVIDGEKPETESVPRTQTGQPATWLLFSANKMARSLQAEVVQAVGRSPGSMVIATFEVPLDRAVSDGLMSPGFAAMFAGRRLNVAPLSARREDLPALVWSLAAKLGIDRERVSIEFVESMARAGWPGGVKEVENVLRDAASATSGTIDSSAIQRPLTRAPRTDLSPPALDDPALARDRLVDALGKAGGSIASAARTLGMSRQAVYREAERLGLTVGKRRQRD